MTLYDMPCNVTLLIKNLLPQTYGWQAVVSVDYGITSASASNFCDVVDAVRSGGDSSRPDVTLFSFTAPHQIVPTNHDILPDQSSRDRSVELVNYF